MLTLVLYWKEKNKGEFSADRFPTYKNVRENVEVYALPSLEYPGHVRVSQMLALFFNVDDYAYHV